MHEAEVEAHRRARTLLRPVINGTGVLLHTNLGRAPIEVEQPAMFSNLEFDLAQGRRGSRQRGVGELLATACGAEAAMVVNNCAAAVLLGLAALAAGRSAAVSRGELVEIGGGFRIPDVMVQSGARLVEVGTTNRTRLSDFATAAAQNDDLAVLLHVHRSNYDIIGFTESVTIAQLATLGTTVVADIGSGLLDAACPWLGSPPPPWLGDEPAARQSLEAGADLVIFSGDKLFGGPQAGIIAGRRDLVARCSRHPLARALRPGGLVLGALQTTTLAYLDRRGNDIPFWRMATTPLADLAIRARSILGQFTDSSGAADRISVIDTEALPGGGTLPNARIPSVGLRLRGDLSVGAASRRPTSDRSGRQRPHDHRSPDDRTRPRRSRDLDSRRSAGPADPMTVVATAGHVDHGKSTLIRMLTGTDPDRWEEEKLRGLTIDLGFAGLELPSGRALSFIDVPGHIRFLRNMLAGVGAVQGCLFVVAATEGWKPQTEEHLRILDLLGVEHGIVALTKADQVDDELLELALLDVAEHVEGTFLERAPVVAVAAPTLQGYDRLLDELDGLVDRMGPPTDVGRPRLWIDRAFAPAGAGTVVTGTLIGGPIGLGDELLLAPQRRPVRVRGLQSHHRGVGATPPGSRLAVNLTGISHHEIRRGDVLITDGVWHHTRTVDAELQVLATLAHDVSRRGAYAAYIGSGEVHAAVRILGPETLAPGTTGFVRLHLDRPLPLIPGDRFILREHGRDETIGGGQIVDLEPVRTASKARPDRSITRLVAERGWVERAHLDRLTGYAEIPDDLPIVGRWAVDPQQLSSAIDALRADIEASGGLGLDIATLDARQRAVLDCIDEAVVDAGRVTLGSPADPLADHPWVEALLAEPFAPPGADGVDRAEVRELVRRGLVIEHDGIYFAAEAAASAARLLAQAFAEQPEGLTVAEIRDLWGTSRKFVLALLGWFDTTGQTRRRDDLRVPGPRLPAA